MEKLDKVTRGELADTVMEATGLKRGKAMDLLNAIFGRMIVGLKEGREVEIRGLGTFRVSESKMRSGISNLGIKMNPENLGPSARKYTVRFKAGKGLRWTVRG